MQRCQHSIFIVWLHADADWHCGACAEPVQCSSCALCCSRGRTRPTSFYRGGGWCLFLDLLNGKKKKKNITDRLCNSENIIPLLSSSLSFKLRANEERSWRQKTNATASGGGLCCTSKWVKEENMENWRSLCSAAQWELRLVLCFVCDASSLANRGL